MEISFGGCGFLGVYHIGVGKCFEDKAKHLLNKFSGYYGASAGAICAAFAACKCDPMDSYKWVKKTMEASRNYKLGMLSPFFDLYSRLRAFLEETLPRDAHRRARGKVRISLTTFPEMKNWVVSDFTTRKELINAIIASSFIPGYAGFKNLPLFRGKRVCDGGFSCNIPFSQGSNVITVSPFSGECDICPQGESYSWHMVNWSDQPIQLSLNNMLRLWNSLRPSSWDYLEELFQKGYQDALRFLKTEGHIQEPSMLSRRNSRDVQMTTELLPYWEPTTIPEDASEYLSVAWESEEEPGQQSCCEYLSLEEGSCALLAGEDTPRTLLSPVPSHDCVLGPHHKPWRWLAYLVHRWTPPELPLVWRVRRVLESLLALLSPSHTHSSSSSMDGWDDGDCQLFHSITSSWPSSMAVL